MAVTFFLRTSVLVFEGLSTDTKPDTYEAPGEEEKAVPQKSIFIETDTKNEFEYLGTWQPRGASGAALSYSVTPSGALRTRRIDALNGTRQRVTWTAADNVQHVVPFVLQNEAAAKTVTHITTADTTDISAAATYLHSVIVNGGTAGAITVYDDTTGGTTTPIAVIAAAAAATPAGERRFDCQMANGIQIATAEATDVTVISGVIPDTEPVIVCTVDAESTAIADIILAQAGDDIDTQQIFLGLGWNEPIQLDNPAIAFDCKRLVGSEALTVLLFTTQHGD